MQMKVIFIIKAWLVPYRTQKFGGVGEGVSIFQGFSHINLKPFQANKLAPLISPYMQIKSRDLSGYF